jgi:peptide/nickel transport system permease protein
VAEATSTARKYTVPKARHWLVDVFVRLWKEKPLGTAGMIIIILFMIIGFGAPLFAQFITRYGVDEIHATEMMAAPSLKYWLGTDQLGRDMLTRIVYGARISMEVGLVGSSIQVLLATIIGIISGFIGGKTDLIIQRFVDAWMCFPGLVILLSIMAIVGPGLWSLIFVLGLQGSIGASRVVRSAVISIKSNVYVEAGKAVGATKTQIMIKHILPNIMAPIIIIFSTAMGAMILAEASLSFLGYGIPVTEPSWGGMLNGAGRYLMVQSPWLAVWPGFFLSVVVFAINMFGDALRDILDPRLKGGLGRYNSSKQKKLEAKVREE